MPVKKVLMPLPDRDFDPSEAALTWQILRAAGHEVRFATPKGLRAFADPRMLSGEGLDLWGWIPLLKKLKLFGLMLRADRFGRAAYAQMEQDPHFLNPLAYAHIQTQDFDALALPGGHAKGMRVYLESAVLQAKVVEFFEEHGVDEKMRPIAAVCHGALLAARSISPTTGRSMLYGRKTTALTWKLEKSAWRVGKFLTRFWEPNYYRTYVESPGEPPAHWSVESEVKRSLKSPDDFLDVPKNIESYAKKTSGLARDRLTDARPAWLVQDGNYLSARWPGDVHTFAKRFVEMIDGV